MTVHLTAAGTESERILIGRQALGLISFVDVLDGGARRPAKPAVCRHHAGGVATRGDLQHSMAQVVRDRGGEPW